MSIEKKSFPYRIRLWLDESGTATAAEIVTKTLIVEDGETLSETESVDRVDLPSGSSVSAQLLAEINQAIATRPAVADDAKEETNG